MKTETKTVVLVLTAVLFYAVANVSIEKWLSKYSTTAVLVIWYPILSILAAVVLLYFKGTAQEVIFPATATAVLLTILVAVMYFIADFSYLNSYASGGSIFTITTLFLTFPVVAGIVKAIVDGQYPSWNQVVGYILVSIAVLLFTKK